MAIKITLRCPSCKGKFSVLDVEPRFCPICGFDTAEVEAAKDARLAAMLDSQTPPHYQHNPVVNSVDTVYRGMEAGSETRVQMAAEMAGVDASEMSSLKMTNMQDNLRMGDEATAKLDNPVTQMMQIAPKTTGATRDPQIESYRMHIASGPGANSGLAAMRGLVQNNHHARQAAFKASGKKV